MVIHPVFLHHISNYDGCTSGNSGKAMYQDLSTFVHAITDPLDAARESFFDICLGLV
jgi:hypothetical protein